MKITVIYNAWGADDGSDTPVVYTGGTHEVVDATDALLRSIAGAEAAGVITVDASAAERKRLDGHVQSQADGEAAYSAAQEAGRWQHGNLVDFIAQRRASYDASEDEGQRAYLAAEITAAEELLAAIEVPS